MENNTSLIFSSGFKVILSYLVITYIPSFVFSNFLLDDFREHFNGFEGDLYWLPMLLIIPILGLVLLLDKLIPKSSGKSIAGKLCPYRYKTVNNILMVAFLYCSFRFYTEYGIMFVHTGDSLADSAGFVKYFYALKVYFHLFLFYELLLLLHIRNKYKNSKILYFMLLVSSYLGLSGSMDIIYLTISVLLFISPKLLLNIVYADISLSIKTVVGYIFAISIGIIVVFIGYANKIGFEQTIDSFLDVNLVKELIVLTTIRFANSYASFICTSNNYLLDFNQQVQAINIPIEVFKYRISVLFNLSIQKPEIFNVSRLNFLNTYKFYHEKAGASPGLLGSALYLPFFPINLLVISYYILFLLRRINLVIPSRPKKISLIGSLLLFLFLIPLTESPIDFLIIIDPSLLYLFLFLLIIQNFKTKH